MAKTLCIYHYNFRGTNHFLKKIINGGKAMERNIDADDKTAKHWRYFYDGYKSKKFDLDKEYKKVIGDFCLAEISKYKVIQEDARVRDFFLYAGH
jgi:hypothetical protein